MSASSTGLPLLAASENASSRARVVSSITPTHFRARRCAACGTAAAATEREGERRGGKLLGCLPWARHSTSCPRSTWQEKSSSSLFGEVTFVSNSANKKCKCSWGTHTGTPETSARNTRNQRRILHTPTNRLSHQELLLEVARSCSCSCYHPLTVLLLPPRWKPLLLLQPPPQPFPLGRLCPGPRVHSAPREFVGKEGGRWQGKED